MRHLLLGLGLPLLSLAQDTFPLLLGSCSFILVCRHGFQQLPLQLSHALAHRITPAHALAQALLQRIRLRAQIVQVLVGQRELGLCTRSGLMS